MSTDLPPPLTPADCNLRDFGYMKLEVERLRRSRQWLIARRRPEVGFYAINLWSVSWHELPAASLEDDDDVLADAAMCPADHWPLARDDVMRGWVKCSDGRLYHRTVAQLAIEAWAVKIESHWRRECDRRRKEWARAKYKGKAPVYTLVDYITVFFPQTAAISSTIFPADKLGHPPAVRGNPAENALKGRESKGRLLKVLRTSVETEVFDSLWNLWPDAARKRHTVAKVQAAIRSQLKTGASGTEIIAAGKAHVEERMASGKPETVKGLAPWLTSGLWRNWAPSGNGVDRIVPPDWPRRFSYWRNNGEWPRRWGPAPDQPGYEGPPPTDNVEEA